MAKKHRVHARSRRSLEAARRATAPRPASPERDGARPAVRAGRIIGRTGAARAVGTPSASLERAAALERAYVVRDFRRIAVVVAISLGLLVASGVLLNVTLR